MKCKCGKSFVTMSQGESTYVGYISPPGHDHDDNCKINHFSCEDGHETSITVQNHCPACDWIGRDDCDCHEGKKIFVDMEGITVV